MKRLILLSAILMMTLFTVCGCKGRTDSQENDTADAVYTMEIMDWTSGEPATHPTEMVSVPEDTTVTFTETTAAESSEEEIAVEDAVYDYGAGELSEGESLVTEGKIDPDGYYTTKDDIALYLYTYGELPTNFMTKKEAQALGWSGGSLEPYAENACIGGTYFGNYEGILPSAPGRTYYECDVDTLGKKSRGAKRIVYSNDGLIYYTDDHYQSFELLYGEE
ncbi:MAG: hypothetical protein MJ071_00375 [Oscillospiraceae bacterium]|nr:hypothetical protein [Oscillospiraceae bacterium]